MRRRTTWCQRRSRASRQTRPYGSEVYRPESSLTQWSTTSTGRTTSGSATTKQLECQDAASIYLVMAQAVAT
eukprot:5493762-Pyramimonas_sp.AAC.1